MNFKETQEVVVLNMLIDGDRRDVGGRYVSKGKGTNKHRHIVSIMGTYIHVELERIVDAVEYWKKKNSEVKND